MRLKYKDVDAIFDYLIENGIATQAEIRLVSDIFGYNTENLNDILFSRTGYRDIDQIEESE